MKGGRKGERGTTGLRGAKICYFSHKAVVQCDLKFLANNIFVEWLELNKFYTINKSERRCRRRAEVAAIVSRRSCIMARCWRAEELKQSEKLIPCVGFAGEVLKQETAIIN